MFLAVLHLLSFLSVTKCVDIDADIAGLIFGNPTTEEASTPIPSLEEFLNKKRVETLVSPNPTVIEVEDVPDACECVPELCKYDQDGGDAKNASFFGAGTFDIGSGADGCKDVCCSGPISDPKALRPQGCGYKNSYGLDPPIGKRNDSQALHGEFPWVIRLLVASSRKYAGVGALIHPKLIITAVHVVVYYTPKALKARAGEWDIQNESEKYPVQERTVDEMRYFPGYNYKNLWHDFGVLFVEDPFVLAPHINVICLPEQNESFEKHRNCEAAGWGKDVFDGRYANILKKVVQNIVPHERCERLMQNTKLGNEFKLHDTFLCAGGVKDKDLCQGDGGAPLVCPIGNNRYKLVGLGAWGIGCGQKNVPAVYAAVPDARNFINYAFDDWKIDDISSQL